MQIVLMRSANVKVLLSRSQEAGGSERREKPHHWSWNTGTERPAVQREQPRSQVKGEGLKWLIIDSAAPKLSIR